MDILKFATFKTFPMFDCYSNFPQWVGNDKKKAFLAWSKFSKKQFIHRSILKEKQLSYCSPSHVAL